MTAIAALLLELLGFAALAAADDRHRRALLAGALPRVRSLALRRAGAGLLAAAALLCVAGQGGAGLCLFLGLATCAAAAVTLAITRRRGGAAPQARAATKRAARAPTSAADRPGA